MTRLVMLAALAFALVMPLEANAQCVRLAPDVCVTKKSYDAPVNEQPFYGFADKTPAMVAADEKFMIDAVQAGKNKVYLAAIMRGQEAFSRGDFATAAQRFNQAYLLEKNESRIYHGFALIAFYRFRDAAYAEELLKIALAQPNPAPSLRGDYGHVLMIGKRAEEARPHLEQAVKDVPNAVLYWNDLTFARLLTRDRFGACDASAQTLKLSPPPAIANGINFLRSKLDCS